jgi:ankyrin repeat protein
LKRIVTAQSRKGPIKVTFDEAHRLIKKGDIIAIRQALDGGLDPNLSNRFSWTLLMLAGLEGNLKIGELLISRGAAIDEVNDFGETALSITAQQLHAPFVQFLLSKGASKDCRPHGHSLVDWITIASGLSTDRKFRILALIQ